MKLSIPNAKRLTEKAPAFLMKFFINQWRPFRGAGIKIKTISPDFRFVEVTLGLHWFNRNLVGTQFGGSIYSMTDPFYMFILIKNLGDDYIVWDKAATVEFKKPGRGKLIARLSFSEEELVFIREQANKNTKYVFDKPVDVLDEQEEVIATVIKTLYVRRKNIVQNS